MSKVNRANNPLFFPLESLETRLDKFSNGLDKFSKGLKRLETGLKPRSSKFLRIEDRESSFEYRASRDCRLTFERYCTTKFWDLAFSRAIFINRLLALRGHDFAFETLSVGHLFNKRIVIWFFKPTPFA